jgi:PAS domain S-box-containing protein
VEDRDTPFRDFCENANDLIQSIAPDGHFLYVNRAWRETLGYDNEEVASLDVFDVIHPDSRAHCEAQMAALLAGVPRATIDADFVTKSGERVPVQGSVTCRFEDDRPVATRGIFRDMREQKRAEEDLDRLFNLSLDLMCVASLDGYYKQVNPAFETSLGYSRQELMSRQFVEFVHEDDRAKTIEELERLGQGLPTVDFENRYRAKDGSYRWLAWRAMPLEDLGLAYAVARDVTEQKRTEEIVARQAEQLERSNAQLEEFAYAASHDLQAPLRAIANLAEWVVEDFPGEIPEDVGVHLDKLRIQVRRMQNLTDDLLAYSRAGRVEDVVLAVDTGELIEEVIALLAPPEGIQIVTESEMPKLATARSPLEQVLRNLIGNAVQHHDRSEGRIVVSAVDRDDEMEFVVSDDGPGIPEEYHSSVFTMFHRLGSFERAESTGIGLALVKKIVEIHGGRVWLESPGERGTTFRFTWPKKM